MNNENKLKANSNNNKRNGSNKNNEKNGKGKKGANKKLARKKLKLVLLITAVLFFLFGFGISYLYSTYKAKNNADNINNSNSSKGTTSEGANEKGGTDKESKPDDSGKKNGQQGTEAGKDTDVPDNKNTADKNNGSDGNQSDTKLPGAGGPAPSNPGAPNVEKLNVEALSKLDNTKYSWWIKLNKEHKTPEITDTIKKMIDKHDGIYIGDTSQKVIYLTFDEGYENGYTPKILDVLKDNDVKAIFFVTGPYIQKNPELVKRMLDEGHQVGNHTINHPSLPDMSYEKLENELLGLDKQFYESFNSSFKYMRPPMGEYSERTLEASKQLGYKTVFWSFAYDDWYTDKIRGADYAYNKVMENIHNGAVLLLHAVSKDNTEALDRIIKDIIAQGYEI
ncbi:MAG TPA: delta-lactam-biosynthetic de-N-acetylase, partial [Clostridiales bacterium]|nr:delta-lactam-biosynthetic de-N-acetylase [Clostridiales bacterium]